MNFYYLRIECNCDPSFIFKIIRLNELSNLVLKFYIERQICKQYEDIFFFQLVIKEREKCRTIFYVLLIYFK